MANSCCTDILSFSLAAISLTKSVAASPPYGFVLASAGLASCPGETAAALAVASYQAWHESSYLFDVDIAYEVHQMLLPFLHMKYIKCCRHLGCCSRYLILPLMPLSCAAVESELLRRRCLNRIATLQLAGDYYSTLITSCPTHALELISAMDDDAVVEFLKSRIRTFPGEITFTTSKRLGRSSVFLQIICFKGQVCFPVSWVQ